MRVWTMAVALCLAACNGVPEGSFAEDLQEVFCTQDRFCADDAGTEPRACAAYIKGLFDGTDDCPTYRPDVARDCLTALDEPTCVNGEQVLPLVCDQVYPSCVDTDPAPDTDAE